jgi:hypothetical protein
VDITRTHQVRNPTSDTVRENLSLDSGLEFFRVHTAKDATSTGAAVTTKTTGSRDLAVLSDGVQKIRTTLSAPALHVIAVHLPTSVLGSRLVGTVGVPHTPLDLLRIGVLEADGTGGHHGGLAAESTNLTTGIDVRGKTQRRSGGLQLANVLSD